MIEEQLQNDREQLEQAMTALENQRAFLGNEVVDAALTSIREKLSALNDISTNNQQRKQATVLFMDIVDSTSITLGLDPEDIMSIMETTLQILTKPVIDHGGRVLRYMGDGFLAIFGAPVAHENDPEMGVRAGLEILVRAQDCSNRLAQQWNISGFNVRVGISTGLVIIGGETNTDNAIMGTTVNLAARLENAAQAGTLLISDHTYQHIRGLFEVQSLEPIAAKGFPTLIQVYRVDRAKPPTFHISTRSVAGIETRMIGRDAELLMLQNIYRDATEDAQSYVVTVVGDAGVGKSRLLHEFDMWIESLAENVWLFKGRATPETETIPYGLFRRLFAHQFGIPESVSAVVVREKFRAGMAVALDTNQADLVGQLLGFDFSSNQSVQDQLGHESFGELAISHLAQYLRVIASQPTVIFLEDIHWADDSSLDLINNLVTVNPDVRLLVICLARPTLFERRPSWGEGEKFHTRIKLRRLSRRATRNLVLEILQKVIEVPTDLRDLIVDSAEGNPFYVGELIKMLIEDGVIELDEVHWRVKQERLAEVRVPPTLAGVLMARLDSLPPKEKVLLQRSAVVGRQFWAAILGKLASDAVQASEVGNLLNNLRSRELIFRNEQSVFESTDQYSFNHILLHETTYETVLLKHRRQFHAQVAHWLESIAGERISEHLSLIAKHYEMAGEMVKALAFVQQLGEESLKISDFRNAIKAYEWSMAIISKMEEDEAIPITNADLGDRAEQLVKLGNLYNRVGDVHRGEKYLEMALSIARERNNPQTEIAALNRLAQIASERGDYETAQSLLGDVLGLAREQDDLACAASALSMLSAHAWRWGDFEQAERCCHESLQIYQQLDDRQKIAKQYNILGILATLQEHYEQAEQYYTQGLEIAKEIDDRMVMADLINNLGYLYHHKTHNFDKAKRCYLESLAIAREIDNRSGITSTLINLGQLHILLSEHQLAWKCIREALVESVVIGAVPLTLDALVGVAQQQIDAGNFISAAELLGLVQNHPALEIDGAQVAESVLKRLRNEIDSEQLEEAMERGRSLELDKVVAEQITLAAEILQETSLVI
jgi:predicted ATPase/class 3 adenylate cyclase